MMTTIWYHIVLDSELVKALEKCLIGQMQLVHDNIISHQIDEGPLGYINDIECTIENFMLAILDISINENSVHFLMHSNIVLDRIYEVFEDLMLEVSWKFIKRVWEKLYKKNMLKELLPILNYYSEKIHKFPPIRFQKKFEKKKTILVSKFWRYIITLRFEAFKKGIRNKDGVEKKNFITSVKNHLDINKDKIQKFLGTKSLFTDYWKKVFDSDHDLSTDSRAKTLFILWATFIMMPKKAKEKDAKNVYKMKLNKELEIGRIYIEVNEDAYKFLKSAKKNDEKCEKFNENKHLERIKNKVLNRELSLWQPKQREYEQIMYKVDTMDQIPERIEEEDEKEPDNNRNENEDSKEFHNASTESITNDHSEAEDDPLKNSFEIPKIEKSAEFPKRRTFIELLNSNDKLSVSYDASTDADRKTRVHTNSPSQFSTQINSDYKNIFSRGRPSVSSKCKQKQLLQSLLCKYFIIDL